MRIKNIEICNFKGLKFVQLNNCGDINAIVGKNNAGKSTILHAIDMAGLALKVQTWDFFQPKLEIKDLFTNVGEFSINITYEDNSFINIKASPNYGPQFEGIQPSEKQKFTSVLVLPDVGFGMLNRQHQTPLNVIRQIENRFFSNISSLDILYTIKYYAIRNERGLSPESYQEVIEEIKNYFPDIDSIDSDRTEQDLATLTYTEYARKLDIVYSGTGLKHFLDVIIKTIISGAKIVLLDEPEMGLHPDIQRRFIEYLHKLSEQKGIQFFMATHSQVLLNYADTITYYRITNINGQREVFRVENDAVYTLLNDLGIRPSDVFNQDMCLLVEGATEIVFFEHIIRVIYKDEFSKIAVAILQYGGGAAESIISGSIDVSNITSAQRYTFWIRDKDTSLSEQPSPNSTKFVNCLTAKNIHAYIWKKREIEYYFPDKILEYAQQGDTHKQKMVIKIKNGKQEKKFRDAAEEYSICVPKGKYLRQLLNEHLKDKDDLDDEIRQIVEGTLIKWKNEIIGV